MRPSSLVVQHLLAQAESELLLREAAIGRNVAGKQRQVVDAPHPDAVAGDLHGQVLERGTQVIGRAVFRLLVIDLHQVAVRVVETVGRSAADVAFLPADPQARGRDRLDAPLQRLGRRGTPGDASDAGVLRFGELERREGVIAVGAQVDRHAAVVNDLHAENIAKVPEGPGRIRREQLDAAQMRDVLDVAFVLGHDVLPVVRARDYPGNDAPSRFA
jgi:hypothetical protein